ncbi:popy class I histocompatibility antigen, alpha chain E-like isoform 3-T3 [Synchiropus picturatus]
MKLSVLALLLFTVGAVNGEKRTLKYIYTAFSLPSKTQIPEFTAMGLLDHMQLDYFDNRNMTKLPRKPWMLRELGQEYFDKGTQSRRNKMQWFKVNLDILMKRMHQNNTDLHVLQWEHGCEVDQQPDGMIRFMRGIDRYSYDGHNFLDYDALNDVWVSTLDAAKLTKDKWNQVKELISYTDGYLKTECMSWLKKFSDFEAKEPRTDKPELYIFSKKSVIAQNHVLTCLATGLPSKNVHLEIRRNNRVLDQTDGLNTSQLSPNHDETFQQRSYVELLRSDKASYSCHVSKFNLQKTWDGKLPTEESNTGIIAGAAVAGLSLILVVVAGVVIYFRRKKQKNTVVHRDAVLKAPPVDEKQELLEKGSYPGPASSIRSEDSGTASSTALSDRSSDPDSSDSTSSTEFLTDSTSNKSDSANESPDSGAGSEDGGSSGASTPPSERRPPV